MEFLSNEKVLVAIIAAVSAVVGGLLTSVIAPWIKYLLEERSKDRARRAALIAEWRDMLREVQAQAEFENDVGQIIQIHPSFLSLEPLLSDEARKAVYAENRTLIVGSTLSAPLRNLKDEISRIESKWGFR